MLFTAFFIYNSNLNAQIYIKAVGDVMPGSFTPKNIIPKDSGKKFLKHLGGMLKYCDISFANLEGAFVDVYQQPCKCADSSRRKNTCFEFGFPAYMLASLKNLGINLFNLDNNHCMDYGFAAHSFTRKLLADHGINYIPYSGYKELYIKNKKIAFVAFGFENYSYNISNLIKVYQIIADLKRKYALVFVSFHGGSEGVAAIHIKVGKEIFLGEDRGDVQAFAHTAIDAGADLIIGHGPHVLRGFELYKNKFIAYSLGNFLTYGNISISGLCGVTCILSLKLDENTGNFTSGEIIPIKQMKPGIPYYDRKKEAVVLLKKLTTETDNKHLFISSDGLITKLK